MSHATFVPTPRLSLSKRLAEHGRLFRLDHSIKQIFVIPGIVIALSLTHAHLDSGTLRHILLGMLSVTVIASSNYVLNELLDAPFDRLHPTKHLRPAACQSICVPLAYLQWIAGAVLGILLAYPISRGLLISVSLLWIMGCAYNIPPVRLKDVPYLDVLSESLNNPIRFCVGWYIITAHTPPVSMLIAYWMLGAYFMALKRFSEYRQIGCESARKYRKSFNTYTEKSLLNSVMFYAATSMLFFGAFIMRYRLEMVFAFPLIALLMAAYFNLAFVCESPVQNPEKLFRERRLMMLLAACCIALVALSFINIPWLIEIFPKAAVLH